MIERRDIETGEIQYWLAVAYDDVENWGVVPDRKLAGALYEKSANLGHMMAQYHLGCMYCEETDPQDFDLDYEKGLKWILKAAEQGCVYAPDLLCSMYQSEEGLSANNLQPHDWFKWFKIAENIADLPEKIPDLQGVDTASIAHLKETLSPKEIEEAEAQVTDWFENRMRIEPFLPDFQPLWYHSFYRAFLFCRAFLARFLNFGNALQKTPDRRSDTKDDENEKDKGNKTVNKKLPHPIMMELLKRLYEPCPFFETCPEAKWSPKLGHVPRGYLGCTGNPDEVEAVFVRAEPGHPLENEIYRETSADELIQQVINNTYRNLTEGVTQAHQNLNWVAEQIWPGTTFDEKLRKVWITETRLCSIDNEIGDVTGDYRRQCVSEHLLKQINILPNATVILFGGKAQKRVGNNISGALKAYALSPPGCNHQPARPSWEAAIQTIIDNRH
jgi:hypothetical protein